MDYLWYSIGVLLQCIGIAVIILALFSPILMMIYDMMSENKNRDTDHD
jgi:hypothetical protein